MKKKIIISIIIFIITIVSFLLVLPIIKVYKNNKIIYISYSDDISKYEKVTCYDDGFSYYENEDITISGINIEKKFIFYIITLEYEGGNRCATEYLLEEDYIKDFIANAEIKHNSKNIDIAGLIEGKKAIVSNTRYTGNDYETSIGYILNGKHEILFIFYKDDMLIIQVGLSDEGPKFIAYK